MRAIFIIITFFVFLNANEINFRQTVIQSTNVDDTIKESNSKQGVLLGIGWGLPTIFTKHTVSQDDKKIDSITKSTGNIINAMLGLYSEGNYFGGRIYTNVSVFKTKLFSVLDGGVNIDLFINFLGSDFFDMGAIFGVGGGMYLVKLDNSLSKNAKVPLSPIGWVNAGFRLKLLGNSLEVIYKMPYIYASLYNNAISMQTPSGFQTKSDMYSMKANSLNINYVYYF